jgi:hypothetical protein
MKSHLLLVVVVCLVVGAPALAIAPPAKEARSSPCKAQACIALRKDGRTETALPRNHSYGRSEQALLQGKTP